jgi:hypothetical protein
MSFAKIDEILDFIKAVKENHTTEIEDVFSNGFCYWFAKILELRFGGTIMFNPNIIHFSILIEEQMFDINGLIDANDTWYNWNEYASHNNVESIVKSCILKV